MIDDEVYGYRQVNVARQRCDIDSLLHWMTRMIRMRRECPEVSWGRCSVVHTRVSEVLVLRHDFRGTALVTLHNFSDRRVRLRLPLEGHDSRRLVNLVSGECHDADGQACVLDLEGYGYRWLRVGGADTVLDRAPF